MNLHDFVALPEEMKALELGDVYSNLRDACVNVKLLLVLNNHKKYATVISEFFCFENEGLEILDVWGVRTEPHFCEEIRVYKLENMQLTRRKR